MQARRLPAARGAHWLLEGLRVFRNNPPLITSLTITWLLLAQLLAQTMGAPGQLLLWLLTPTAYLIIANGCRLADAKTAPSWRGLRHGVSNNSGPLFRLGGLLVFGYALVLLADTLLGGGVSILLLPPAETATAPATSALIGDDGVPQGGAEELLAFAVLRLLLLSAPLFLIFLFTAYMVGWDRVAPLKSLFFSAVAVWRNLPALFIFGLVALLFAFLAPAIVLTTIGQIFGMTPTAVFFAMRLLLVFFVAPVLFAGQYACYRDIFHPGVDDNA